MSKITVIGAGSVGSTIANDLMIQGTASEIVLIDVNKQKAFGEAMDIYQGAPFCSPTIVRSGDYDAASGSDIVIITSGLPRKAGQSRLELAQANVNIIKDIAPQITAAAPDAIYIIVSNPVDVLTYVFHKISGVPESHITPKYLTNLVRRISGQSAHDLIVYFTIIEIKALLRESALDMKTIASRVNFRDLPTFSRFFQIGRAHV